MKLFKTIDEKFEDIGFIKAEENEFCVVYERLNSNYQYIQTIAILHKKSGRHIVQSYDTITNYDILKEVYFYQKHSIDNEDEFIMYLLSHGVTHKELNEGLEIPLRRIQSVSKKIERKEN